jgi:peptidoglycan/xylan/chitin deacetylase (PgdA/CDA1 family)
MHAVAPAAALGAVRQTVYPGPVRSPRAILTSASSVPGWLRTLVALGLVLALSACGNAGLPAATWQEPSPAVPSDAAPATATPEATPTGLDALLAKLPRFPSAPAPVPIKLPLGSQAPIYYRLPITAPVAFLTIDDGFDQLPQDLTVMQAAHVPFSMFLIGPVAARNPTFFTQLESDGGVIEDHTMTHPELKGKPYGIQQPEICGARTLLAKTFGRTPTLFRPPFGDYDTTTLQVVHDCGLTAAFYWSETVNAGIVRYQASPHKIRPGDIILMHFRPTFAEDVLAALTAIHDAGLTPALLEDYVAPPGSA